VVISRWTIHHKDGSAKEVSVTTGWSIAWSRSEMVQGLTEQEQHLGGRANGESTRGKMTTTGETSINQ